MEKPWIHPFCIIAAFLLAASSFTVHAENYNPKEDTAFIDAIYLIDDQQYDAAITKLDSIAAVHPNSLGIEYEKAYAYYLSKDYDKCIEVSTNALALIDTPNADEGACVQLYAMLGNIYDILGEPDKSIDMYRQGIARFPKAGTLYYNMGATYYGEQKFKESINAMLQGIDNAPAWASNYLGIINLGCKMGRYYLPAMAVAGYAMLDPEKALGVGEQIPAYIHQAIKQNDEDGTNFTIGLNVAPGMPGAGAEAMLPLMLAAMGGEYTLSGDVEALWAISGIDTDIMTPVTKYLKKLQEAGLDKTFWYWLIGGAYPAEFADWANDNEAKLTELFQWMNAHPYPLQ